MNHCILQASFFFLMEARTDLRLRVSQELLTKVLQKVVTREGQCGTWWDWALRNRSQSHKILPQMSHSLFCGMLESKHSLFNQKLSLQNQVVFSGTRAYHISWQYFDFYENVSFLRFQISLDTLTSPEAEISAFAY